MASVNIASPNGEDGLKLPKPSHFRSQQEILVIWVESSKLVLNAINFSPS
jgi:hypothetical protein